MKKTVQTNKTTGYRREKWISVALEFTCLFAFWLILSGHYKAKYIIIGALAAAAITFLTNDLFYDTLRRGEAQKTRLKIALLQLWNFILYLPWLILQIILANVQVACLVLNPKMPIEPVLFLFQTKMRKGMAQVTLANSITLTPGTITVSLVNGNYIIHTLKLPLAGSLADGTMQNKVAKIYLENEVAAPTTRLAYSLEEIKP